MPYYIFCDVLTYFPSTRDELKKMVTLVIGKYGRNADLNGELFNLMFYECNNFNSNLSN